MSPEVETVEKLVKQLSPEGLKEFSGWFAEFEEELWDRQFEADVNAGRFDELGARALRDYEEGRTTPL